MLTGVDLIAERIQASNGVIDMQPWVQRRYMHAVPMNSYLDTMIHNRAERRSGDNLGIRRGHPPESSHLHPAAQVLEPRQQIRIDFRNMMHYPAQFRDVRFFVDGFP